MEEKGSERLKRKILRHRSNSLELPEPAFIAQYRLNKETFRMVLDSMESYLPISKLSPVLQLAATCRFLAAGSYQRSVGSDTSIDGISLSLPIAVSSLMSTATHNKPSAWTNWCLEKGQPPISRASHFLISLEKYSPSGKTKLRKIGQNKHQLTQAEGTVVRLCRITQSVEGLLGIAVDLSEDTAIGSDNEMPSTSSKQ